ncbi:MAG: hypothetical protein D5R98_04745 [Desulfonatronovibrio sp. MSAO_Bac4]|nr:MAG: hypothetical protein D5R98_04745 [Desulfonatronovibrio sp. MSAO_Bac4]
MLHALNVFHGAMVFRIQKAEVRVIFARLLTPDSCHQGLSQLWFSILFCHWVWGRASIRQ